MKAIVYRRYGPPEVLQLEEIPKPSPRPNEVLVEVQAASINAGDWHLMRADPYLIRLMGFGLLRPKHPVLGFDVAGRVVGVGGDARGFMPGDPVFGVCEFGGFAEYACVKDSLLMQKPANLSFEQAAASLTSGYTALQALRTKGRIEAGKQVLIDGASGGVGTFALQIAKTFGAEVTAVCSTRNLDMARSLGAAHVIDYTAGELDFGSGRYDLIMAANGSRSALDYVRYLKPRGICVITGGSGYRLLQSFVFGPFVRLSSGKTITNLLATPNSDDLSYVKALLERGAISPVIDRRYGLSDVPEAIRYIENVHASGKVVISV